VFCSAQYARVATHEKCIRVDFWVDFCLAMQDFADQKVQEGLPEGEKEKFKVLHLF